MLADIDAQLAAVKASDHLDGNRLQTQRQRVEAELEELAKQLQKGSDHKYVGQTAVGEPSAELQPASLDAATDQPGIYAHIPIALAPCFCPNRHRPNYRCKCGSNDRYLEQMEELKQLESAASKHPLLVPRSDGTTATLPWRLARCNPIHRVWCVYEISNTMKVRCTVASALGSLLISH
eukprot:SAG31_NODE_2502_length_5594_cov_3.175796_8_plen_179_part_00